MKYVFITSNFYCGQGEKIAAEIHDIPESHCLNPDKAEWWFLNRISFSACLEMKAIPLDKWMGVIDETGKEEGHHLDGAVVNSNDSDNTTDQDDRKASTKTEAFEA